MPGAHAPAVWQATWAFRLGARQKTCRAARMRSASHRRVRSRRCVRALPSYVVLCSLYSHMHHQLDLLDNPGAMLLL